MKAPLEFVFVILMAIKVKEPEVFTHFSLVKYGATRPIAKQGPPAVHNLLYPQRTSMNLFILLFLFSTLKLSASAGVRERTQIPSKIITPRHAQAWPSHVDSIGQTSTLPSAPTPPPQILQICPYSTEFFNHFIKLSSRRKAL